MEKPVIWSDYAIKDIREIYHYIRSDSVFYADRILDEIVTRVKSLPPMPNRGRITPEFDNNLIREIFVKQYRVIYEIEENRIVIHGIIHMARDFESVWKKRELL